MMTPSSAREVKEWLSNAGNRLADLPSSDDQLLPLLDQVESRLSTLHQEHTNSIHNALSPLLMVLVANKLLHHPNSDVKVAVASCLCEFARITAPDAPYDDDQLKDVFQLIVSSFANLNYPYSRSYVKRISILTIVSKVRLCTVMLDLELETLIAEMFQHFLREIRHYHPDDVFSSMETIMTLVLEESDNIPQELLSPILASLRNHNEEVLPIARKLGERVLESCAAKVKPYLLQTVESLRIFVDDYSPVVASICEQEMPCVIDPADRPATPDQMAEKGIGATKALALESESPPPSQSLLGAKLGKCKVELMENQKMYADLVAVNDGLKKSKARLEKWIAIVVIVFGVVLYAFL